MNDTKYILIYDTHDSHGRISRVQEFDSLRDMNWWLSEGDGAWLTMENLRCFSAQPMKLTARTFRAVEE